jgi:hypothetical protein
MQALEATLLALERGFWTGDASYYQTHLAAGAEMVLPLPAGMLDRDETLDSIAAGPRWSRVAFIGAHVVPLTQDSAMLVYRCRAEREPDLPPYQVLATSAYVRTNGEWQLACHQQTPADSGPAQDEDDLRQEATDADSPVGSAP